MVRTLLFLAAESLLFTGILGLTWLVLRHAVARLGGQLDRLGLLALSLTWLVLWGINFALTRLWGPSFTALYRLSGLALLGAFALWVLSVVLRRARRAEAEPS